MRRQFRRRSTRPCGKRRFRRAVAEDRTLPVRIYECPRCGGWHLTSRPLM